MRHIRLVILLFILILTLLSCKRGYLFEDSRSLDPAGWQADDFLQFVIPVENLDQEFNIMVHLRHDGRYEYSNLFLFINTYAPTGASIRDTLECMLSDVSGRWFGRGIGGHYTIEVPFKRKVRFPYKGNYRIEIQHGMHRESQVYQRYRDFN